MLLPALARSKARAQGISCINNMKQLQLAWLLYAGDFGDRVPQNPSSDSANGNVVGENDTAPAWVAGRLSSGSNTDNTNTLKLVGSQYEPFGSLGGYAKASGVYRCPSDRSSDPQYGPRIHSCSINGYVGPTDKGKLSAGYLTGSREKYLKTTDFIKLRNTEAIIFLDERPEQINDGWFRAPTSATVVEDLPAIYHGNSSSSFAYADGHAELHKWTDPRFIALTSGGSGNSPAGSVDIAWLYAHCTSL